MATTYDAIVIGAGHNGLVCAAYLAKAGRSVLVLERREIVGGACVTEEPWPGYKVSTASYVNSLFRPQIVRELDLEAHGYAVIERDPASFSPFLDGRCLMLGRGTAKDAQEIAKFSKRDAERFPQYEAMLEGVAAVVEPTLDQAPPNALHPSLADLRSLWLLRRRLLRTAVSDVVEVLTGAARPILDRWFESEQLKGTLATDAIIGAMAAPSMPGTAYVLFHHVMGETNGKKGVWAYMRGGMGNISQALAGAAKAYGAQIRTQAEVARIDVRGAQAVGVVLANGDEYRAKTIASGVDAHLTFERFMNPASLPGDFRKAVARIDYSSGSVKINLGLDSLPRFAAAQSDGRVGPEHRGTIHFCEHQDFIERAYDDAKYGVPSREPVVELHLPSAVDDTLAPAGKFVASMFVQYAPYRIEGRAWTQADRDAFADRCFAVVERYAPGFTESVLQRQVLTPADIEERFGLTGGNIFQGAMTLDNLFAFRPAPGYANYRTPIRNLYLCGSAAHPGGGVMGAAGRNAALAILQRR
jgi:phytoene dehydrogenase-like protein